MACVATPFIKLSNGQNFMPFLGLGTVQHPTEVKKAVCTAIDIGYRHLDCAELYGNEKEIGESLQEKFSNGTLLREHIFITSKVWATNQRPEKVQESCDRTLKNLQLDYIDLYLIHAPFSLKEGEEMFPKDPDGRFCLGDIDYLDTWKAMESLVKQQKVRYIGVSNFNIQQLQRILAYRDLEYRPICNQIEMSPYCPNERLLSFCNANQILIVGYSPLGSPARPWAKKDDPILLQEPILKQIAKYHRKTTAQVVLRWGIQRGYAIIPKSSNPERLKENFEVFNFCLTQAEMDQISSLKHRNVRVVGFEAAKHSQYYPFLEEPEAPPRGILI